jgi:DNA-binding response OmpR family regulator
MSPRSGYLLIAEDDPDILKLLNTTLTFRGYRVITVPNGKDGLEVIRKDLPAMVIADIMMPKLDGFGLVHRLRINPETRNIPVIFITATYVAPEDKEFALSIGVTRFIQKPVDLEMLLAVIDELMEQDAAPMLEPLKEFSFYEGYRVRLESKLAQKNREIARDELLLKSRTDEDDQLLRVSLRHSTIERDELKLLLEQVYKHLAAFPKAN